MRGLLFFRLKEAIGFSLIELDLYSREIVGFEIEES